MKKKKKIANCDNFTFFEKKIEKKGKQVLVCRTNCCVRNNVLFSI